MQNDDEIPQTVTGSYAARETYRLYRLTPSARDLPRPAQRAATVAAETEDDARAFAAAGDPFGVDWTSRVMFDCDFIDTAERHVVGDVWFRSIAPAAPQATRRTSRK